MNTKGGERERDVHHRVEKREEARGGRTEERGAEH